MTPQEYLSKLKQSNDVFPVETRLPVPQINYGELVGRIRANTFSSLNELEEQHGFAIRCLSRVLNGHDPRYKVKVDLLELAIKTGTMTYEQLGVWQQDALNPRPVAMSDYALSQRAVLCEQGWP